VKNIFKSFGLLISIFLPVLSIPAYTHGEERSFAITNVEIHARIDSDGNIDEEEKAIPQVMF